MDLGALKRVSERVLLGLALLFLVILFLDWHRTSVVVVGEGDAQAGASGWSGWGLLAGICALAVLGLEFDRVVRKRSHEGQALVDLALAVGVALATVAAVFTGDTSVTAGPIGTETGATLWPAWVGLVLAIAMAVVAFVAVLPESKAEAPSAARNLS
jgi:hypothetical protein